MPKKRTFPESNTYLVTWVEHGNAHWIEYTGVKLAVDGYRYMRKFHGDNCRLVKVVLNYGTEV